VVLVGLKEKGAGQLLRAFLRLFLMNIIYAGYQFD
jgi:hypothetical protein